MQVTETIKKIIAKQLSRSPEEITDDSELASLGIESLDLLEIVYEIETQFKKFMYPTVPMIPENCG